MAARTRSAFPLQPVLPLWNPTTFRDTTEGTQPSQKHESVEEDIATEICDASVRLDKVREILGRLRKWHSWETERQQSLRRYLLRSLFPRRPACPSHDELKDLATFFFPLRKLLQVTVCDIGNERFERHDTIIGDLEPCKSSPDPIIHTDRLSERQCLDLRVKPSWATVRWM